MLNAEYVTIMMFGDKRTTHRSATTPIVLVLHIQQTFLSRVLESVKVRSLLIYFTAFPQSTGYTVCPTLTGGISKGDTNIPRRPGTEFY